MNFIMTTFMYPLDVNNRPRIFGKLYFDNPRTTEEVNYVAHRLKQMNLSDRPSFADRPGLVSEEYITLMSIYDYFYQNNKSDVLVQQFDKKYGGLKDIYKKFARMWIIVRSEEIISEEDTKGKFAFYKSKENETKLYLIDDYPFSIIEYNKEKIADYFALMTFLLGEHNLSINLLDIDFSRHHKMSKGIFINLLVMSTSRPTNRNKEKASYPYGIFKFIEPRIVALSKRIGNKYNNKRFLFLCKKIHNALELYNKNQEMAFVEIVSIIEMLLSHNPDSGRFNVEDSITKQFVGKLTLLLYENDKNMDLDRLKKELKFAYSIRSAIAHGDFNNLEDQLNKLFQFVGFTRGGKGIDYKDNRDALGSLLGDACDWLRVVINLYLDDEKRLDLIKTL